jgi:hypothetical protein
MKKVLVSVGSILIMAFLVVLFVNANDSVKDPKKAKAEGKKTETAMPCSSACSQSPENKTATCNLEKCKELNCSPESGKCDPTTCQLHKEVENSEIRKCGNTTACPGTCTGKTKAAK